jgi:phage terminase small subunit
LLRIANHTLQLLMKLQAELGFTPCARARLGQPTLEAEEIDAGWAALRRLSERPNGKTPTH